MIGCLVLAYNEEKYVENHILEIAPLFEKVIIVNDGSTDKTKYIIHNLKLENLEILNNKKNKGPGKSMEIGISEFLKSDLKYLIKIDGDSQFKLRDIKSLIKYSEEKYDFIKCDRFWEKGIDGKIPTIRYVGNALASLLIKISTGNWKLNDPLNGLFLFSRRSVENFSLPRIFHRYGYPFYLNIFMNEKIIDSNFKNAQMKNTIKYSDQKSRLRPSIMFAKLIYYSILTFVKKIMTKLKYSNLQTSGLLDILFLSFSSFTIFSTTRLILINLDYMSGSKASWLFLTILMFFIASFCFNFSQAYEKKIYEEKFYNL